ncbi:hypothetical protein OEZ86_005444 [Tetradesmus obliquus]|nr:hypothetical protein OEZ86_005444 [Tetradesmus obliquus]
MRSKGFPELQLLDVCGCAALQGSNAAAADFKAFRDALLGLPQLKVLLARRINLLGWGCNNLRRLGASGCPTLAVEGGAEQLQTALMSSTCLTSFTAGVGASVTDSVLLLLGGCPHLQHLCLSLCPVSSTGVSAVIRGCPKLTSLQLQQCVGPFSATDMLEPCSMQQANNNSRSAGEQQQQQQQHRWQLSTLQLDGPPVDATDQQLLQLLALLVVDACDLPHNGGFELDASPHGALQAVHVVRCQDLGQAAAAAGGQHDDNEMQQAPDAEATHHHHHHHRKHAEQGLADDRACFGSRCDKQLVVHLLPLSHSLHLPP